MNKILIVEDEKLIRDQLVKIAESVNQNVDVLSAATVAESLKIAEENEIRVFFIDIRLKGEDGIELAKEIRKMKEYRYSMIVFVSSMTDRRLEAFEDTHCYDFLDKNFLKMKELKENMRDLLVEYLQVKVRDRLVLDFNLEKRYLKFSDILYIIYEDRSIYVQTYDKKIEHKQMSLKSFMEQLPDSFVIANKKMAVNMDRIEYIDKKGRKIKFENSNMKLKYSRMFKKRIEGYEHDYSRF